MTSRPPGHSWGSDSPAPLPSPVFAWSLSPEHPLLHSCGHGCMAPFCLLRKPPRPSHSWTLLWLLAAGQELCQEEGCEGGTTPTFAGHPLLNAKWQGWHVMEWWATFTAWLCSKLNQVKIYLNTTQRMNGNKEMGPVAFTRTGYQVSRSWPSTAAVAKECARWNWETVEDLFWGKVMGKKKIRGALLHKWRRKWQPTAVFLLGKSHGQRTLVGVHGTLHGFAKSQAWLSAHIHIVHTYTHTHTRVHTHTHTHTHECTHTHTHTHCRRAHAVWLWAGHLTSLILLLFW